MIGTPEILLILLAVVLLFGAAKLPELARSLGRSAGEFKKAKKESEAEIEEMESSLKTANKSQKIQDIAKGMGIDVKGKTDTELLDEIKKISKISISER